MVLPKVQRVVLPKVQGEVVLPKVQGKVILLKVQGVVALPKCREGGLFIRIKFAACGYIFLHRSYKSVK